MNLRKRKRDALTAPVRGGSTSSARKRPRKKISAPAIVVEPKKVSDVSRCLPFMVGNTYFKIEDINLNELKVTNFVV